MQTDKKKILTGADSFEKIIEGDYFYVDKTLFIKELLENRGEVTLITRPRRFGKTLNMHMLGSFFSIRTPSATSLFGTGNNNLFDGLKIMEHKSIVEKHMHKYPVIFLTLKNIEESTYTASIEKFKILIRSLYRQNRYLCDGDKLDEYQMEIYRSLLTGKANEGELESSLLFLTECLHTYHNKRAIILIDEYDAPISNALMKGYYEDMIGFMRGFLGGAFKTNNYLEFGVLTGVQRISKEGLVSGFNNPKVSGIMDREFATCFGFTDEEVKASCEMLGMGDKYGEVKEWYDGYRFGGRDMYNPWSVCGYLDRGVFDNYWVNTGSVKILQDVFNLGDNNLRDEFAGLITGSPVTMSVEDGITYPIKYASDNTFWTMLLSVGYIKPCNGAKGDVFNAELVNKEVRNIFTRYAKEWFGGQNPEVFETILEFVKFLQEGDADAVSGILNNDLLNNPSCHDFIMENSYHMFIYGLLYAASGKYTVYSNPEAGKGRSDCVIKPIGKNGSAVVVEFKHVKRIAPGGMEAEAQKALNQIEEKAYIHTLLKEGYKKIFKYGIAFHKKTCAVAIDK